MTWRAATRGRRTYRGVGLAVVGSLLAHAAVFGWLVGSARAQALPPVRAYKVKLVAAPRVTPEERRAPEVIDRPAQRQRPVARRPEPRRNTMADAPPPPDRDEDREPAPRRTPEVEPLPDETPSTGSDPVTVSVEGLEFPFPEYLANIVTQVYRRWQRPSGAVSRRAEVLFFIRRDGSMTNFQFVVRSGDFSFDLEAQGAVEATANAGAFGPLPEGFAGEILAVSFFFDPSTLR